MDSWKHLSTVHHALLKKSIKKNSDQSSKNADFSHETPESVSAENPTPAGNQGVRNKARNGSFAAVVPNHRSCDART